MPTVSKLLGLAALCRLAPAAGQQAGTLKEEVHPKLWLEECTASGCESQPGALVIDANWRWVNEGGRNCYKDDNSWDADMCSDGKACAKRCSVEGADYRGTYGVIPTSTGQRPDGVRLNFVTQGKNFGSRLYVMDREDKFYRMFHLKNREFSFDVDVSNLRCGLNGALYFVEMDKNGDFDGDQNAAGAKYGTGYCDAQCPHDLKFIKGDANVDNWNRTAVPPTGHYGSCCAEMDIWEANNRATAYTPHPCKNPGLTKCEGIDCGDNAKGQRYDGLCDKDGCDFNSWRMGETSFYGSGSDFEIDTSKPLTVVTQFLTTDGTDTGDLSQVKRFYVQNGNVVPNSQATILGSDSGNSVTDDFCSKQKEAFGDINDFGRKGGLKKMGEALDRGMVLVISLWDDTLVNMLWLDSNYPANASASKPGVSRGPCPGGADSLPENLRQQHGDSHVDFSKIKVGSIGSTSSAGGSGRRLDSTLVV